MVQIIPAILATSEEQYQADIAKLASAQSFSANWVHIDLADNIFVQNKTIKPEVIQKFPNNFRKEAHLMVANPKTWIGDLVESGFEKIIIHIESDDINESLDIIETKGLESGLAINNETPVEKLEPFIDKINTILIMTIVPGFQGQPFIPEALDKVKEIKFKHWPVRLGVDGHVNNENAKEIANAGVDFMIVGSYLLKGDIDENLERLWEEIYGTT